MRYLLILILVFLFNCSETFETHFDTYADLKISNTYSGGWVPQIIPESAINIKEKHNIDVNNSILIFNVENAQKEMNLIQCKEIQSSDNIIWSTLNAIWWPNELSKGANLVNKYQLYTCSCENCNGYFAVKGQTVYFWRP